MQCNEISYLLQKDEMIIIHPRTVHSIYAADDNPLKYAVLKFDINKFQLSSPYAPKLRTIFKQADQQKRRYSFQLSYPTH